MLTRTNDSGSRVAEVRNIKPLKIENSTAFMLTPIASVAITASDSGAVLRFTRNAWRRSRTSASTW